MRSVSKKSLGISQMSGATGIPATKGDNPGHRNVF